MPADLQRLESDIQLLKHAIGLDQPKPPDSPVPHLLLAAAGLACFLLALPLNAPVHSAWALPIALVFSLPPLAAMILWAIIKKRSQRAPAPTSLNRKRRESLWSLLATASFVGIMMSGSMSLVSGPIILGLLALLAGWMLYQPIVEHAGFSSIGWAIAIFALAILVGMGKSIPWSLAREILGLTLLSGGLLAALFSRFPRKVSTP